MRRLCKREKDSMGRKNILMMKLEIGLVKVNSKRGRSRGKRLKPQLKRLQRKRLIRELALRRQAVGRLLRLKKSWTLPNILKIGRIFCKLLDILVKIHIHTNSVKT